MFKNIVLTHRLATVLLAVPILVSSGISFAQEEADTKSSAIEEVIVTAQKKEQNLQDISISIKALSAETLETVKADSLDDIVRLVPSLSMTDLARGGNNVQIRGLGSNVGNVGTVAIYNDGVISPNRIQSSGTFAEQDAALYDIERVEVLRGPQGTLYGEGSFGGVINIISNQPDATQFSASALGTWFDTKGGSSDNYDLAGMINVPLVKDTLALRVVGFKYDHGGYIDAVNVLPLFFGMAPELVAEDANTEEVSGGRFMLGWTPNDSFDATLIYKSQETDLSIYNYDSPDLIELANMLGGTSFEPNYTQAMFDSVYGSNNQTDEAILTMNLNTSIGVLTSITGLGDVTDETASGLYAKADSFTQELRLFSDNDSSMNWMLGAYYRTAERDIDYLGFPYNTNGVDQWSVYGQLYWDISSDVMATFGLRYDQFDTKSTDELIGTPPVDADFDDVSPKVAIDWKVSDDTLLYASIAKGFRAGGTNQDESFGTDPAFNASFDPDYVWNYEIGAKSGFLDNKVTINAAVFYIDWHDVQIDKAINSLISPPYSFIVTNGDKAYSYGFETDIYIYPSEGWEILLGGSLVEAEFNGGTIDTAVAGLGVPLDGQRLASSPKYTFNASLERNWNFGSDWEGFARADYSARGSSYADVPNQAPPGGNFASGSTNNLNLRAGVRRDTWAVQAFVTNATDEYDSTFNFWDGGFGDIHVVLRPRTYGVSLNLYYN